MTENHGTVHRAARPPGAGSDKLFQHGLTLLCVDAFVRVDTADAQRVAHVGNRHPPMRASTGDIMFDGAKCLPIVYLER